MADSELLKGAKEITSNTEFKIKPDESGIDIKSIDGQGQRWFVETVHAYVPWNFGRTNPGAGQLGVLEVKIGSDSPHAKRQFILTQDYRRTSEDWAVNLLRIADTEWHLKEELMMDPLGLSFMDYLFPHLKY